MGIDYSTDIGYGIAIAEDKLPEALRPFKDNPYEDGDLPAWLADKGFDHVGYVYAGDHMSGTCYFFFYAKDSFFSNHPLESETLLDFTGTPEADGYFEIIQLAHDLGLSHDEVGWKLINNVS